MTIEEEWQSLLRTPSTRKFYQLCLDKFCDFSKKRPAQLSKLDDDKAKKLVIQYVLHLKNIAVNTAGKPIGGQLSVNSVPLYIAGLKSFLDYCELTLPWKKIKSYFPEEVAHSFRAYKLAELRRLLALADRRERVILLLMISSGLRVGAIPDLRFKHLEPLENGLAKLHVYAESKRNCYWTLITPECVQAVEEYKQYRMEQVGEKITQESFIIRDAYKVRPVLVGTIRKTIWELFKKTGLNGVELQPDHACRKYFNTVCINAGMNHTLKEIAMGHSVKLDDTYYDLTNEGSLKKAIEEYSKAVPELTITEEARKMLSNEIKLKNVPELERLTAENERLSQALKHSEASREITETELLKRVVALENKN
jgi:integrase